ncbi:MAG: preprotein translocase subunit SecE [Chloroflexi bacterium]|nr:preprotein translocase subunit SecE [Chloroflexota bacterium]MCH8816371.1 preprotein translocase subunit SecE [Chloroflexota bacterium]
MASRQPTQRAIRTAGAAPRGGVFRFFIEVIAELRRTTWPTRQEATRLSILVLIVSAFFGVFLGAIDYGFGQLSKFLIGG